MELKLSEHKLAFASHFYMCILFYQQYSWKPISIT